MSDVLGAGEYEECIWVGEVQTTENLPFDDEGIPPEEDDRESTSQHGSPMRYTDIEDTSVLVPMRQNKSIETSSFEKALATFADLAGLSRQDWASLREVLFLIRDKDGSVPSVIQSLPKQLSTLRDRIRRRMPMMNMREADIPLNILKLPTMPASLKPEERRKVEIARAQAESRSAALTAARAATRISRDKGKHSTEARDAVAAAEKAKSQLDSLRQKHGDISLKDLPRATMRLTFFDPITVFKNIIASDILGRIHTGPGLFVDKPRELFHSHAWLSSVRSTSGFYAHVIIDGIQGPAIFPSDWVYFRCTSENCVRNCCDIEDDSADIVNLHIGRVYGAGLDHREDPCTQLRNQMCLQIQEAYRLGDHRLANIEITPPQTDRELILSANLVYVPETSVFGHLHVYIDHHTGEEHEDPGWNPPRRTKGPPPEPLPKYVRPVFARLRREDEWYECRRILVKEEVLPLCRTHPIRAELGLQHFGRHVFEHGWDHATNDMPVVSLPHLDFIDGFGVFQNSYRTLMGFYFTPAGLGEEERFRPGSIFPIVLG
jgi:predicted DsbA family dithiol-disulfide isomerase